MSHQITVDITRLTVPVSVETKKTQIQKTSRASREEFLQKPPIVKKQQPGKRHTHEIKKCNIDVYK